MQPITLTVGPLAAGSANAVALSQTPSAGVMVINGTPSGGKTTKGFQGTGSISANVLTITATSFGAVTPGQLLTGLHGILPNTVVLAPGPVANTWIVNNAQTVTSTTIIGGEVVTMDQPRQVLITTVADESGNTFTISGTDWAGDPISETLAGPAIGTVASVLSYLTVTQVAIASTAGGAITVGTNGVASSPWARLDGFAGQTVALQCDVSAAGANYTVQSTMDDPNSPTNPTTPAAMTWINSTDNSVVNASASAQSFYPFVPLWMRVVLNSGSGSVSMTLQQHGVAPY